jgi:hypothetical protein
MEMNHMIITTVTLLALVLKTATSAHSGSIAGVVRFSGATPAMPAVVVSKDQDYCGDSLPNDTYLVESSGGLQNAVVFLESAPSAPPADSQKLNVIENDGCRYVPRIKAMQKGERLRIKNNDPKLHIPHSYLAERTVFMLSLPFKNTAVEATQKIKDPGVLKLVCDTHAWMIGYLHVFDHPYFALSDGTGTFSIPNVPVGRYILNAWHEEAGTRRQEITITEGGDVRVEFEFSKN